MPTGSRQGFLDQAFSMLYIDLYNYFLSGKIIKRLSPLPAKRELLLTYC